MRRCITRMHEKHAMVFGGMMVRLNVSRNIDFYQGFLEVSEELFKEEINWSKIVALYAFGARLAQFCQENEMEDLLKEIASSLARFSNDHLLAYIQEQGGWVSYCNDDQKVVTKIMYKCVNYILSIFFFDLGLGISFDYNNKKGKVKMF